MATARDAVGRGLAHKAVLYGHKPLLDWLAKKYPETIHLKDNVSLYIHIHLLDDKVM